MSYDIVPIDAGDQPDVVKPSVKRLSSTQDIELRIKSLNTNPDIEAIATEVEFIAEAYQSGLIPKRAYSNYLDQLLDLRQRHMSRCDVERPFN